MESCLLRITLVYRLRCKGLLKQLYRRREFKHQPSAETMKLLANRSDGYYLKMKHSRHTLTKYFRNYKTNATKDNKLSRKLDHVKNPLYEVQLAPTQIEIKEAINVVLFQLPCGKLRTLQLYYFFLQNFVT